MCAALGTGRDKSDGLSRAEIRCGFHAIQAEAKRRQEAAARRKRHEALRKEAREEEARKAEAARCEERLLDVCRCWKGNGKPKPCRVNSRTRGDKLMGNGRDRSM